MRAMISFPLALTCAGLVALAVSAAQTSPPLEDKPPAGIEVQTRGPVHEAFLQITDIQPAPSEPIPKKPPQPVPELPPEFTPEGDNIQFIPGYWAWDAPRKDLIWVSGVQRNVPAGRRWVPGYWTESPEGWRWVSGFWAPEQQQEVPYAPEPPATLENGPSLPGPDDSIYTPGHWVWRDSRFVWRPGYYAPARLGRIWVQPRYSWTPGGYIFVDGYWDYPLEDRGLLYAPVYFTQRYWDDPTWCYRPWYWVRHSCLLDYLFYRPLGCHYYFGDWYGGSYLSLGFYPWFGGPCHYDPFFSYYRWCNRGYYGWHGGLRTAYDDRCAGRAAVPPQTLVQQNNIVNNNAAVVNKTPRDRLRMVEPLRAGGVGDKEGNLRLVKTGADKLELGKKEIQRSRELANVRAKTETTARAGRGSETTQILAPANTTLKLPDAQGTNRIDAGNKIGGNADTSPRVKDTGSPRLKDNPSSQPRVVDNPSPKPRTGEIPPSPQPKGINNPALKPGNNGGPASQPRVVDNPAPAPRISSPAPAPSISSPAPAPRISSPAPAPRISSPAPAPRISSPSPAPRSSPAPRPSGGGSRPGRGK